jgi:PRTRC genetic system protein E
MFKELVPILRNRAVLMTATALDDDQIRVNVVPKKMKDGDHDALTTPLSVTGTAEELDTQLAATLVGFVASHLQMKNALEKAKSEMDAATKTAQPRRAPNRKLRQGQYRRRRKSLRMLPPPSLPSQRSPHRRSRPASSICRRHRLPLPPPRQPNRKMTQDLQKSTMTNQSKRSKNWMTRPDGNNSSLQEGIG